MTGNKGKTNEGLWQEYGYWKRTSEEVTVRCGLLCL